MIHLKFLSSPDENVLGDYHIAYTTLVVSTRPGGDLFLSDPKLTSSIIFRAVNEGLKITYDDHFFVNGKKLSGSKILKSADRLRVGETEISVVGSLPTPIEHQKNIIEALEERVRNEPEISELVVELEKELIRIEQEKHNQNR